MTRHDAVLSGEALAGLPAAAEHTVLEDVGDALTVLHRGAEHSPKGFIFVLVHKRHDLRACTTFSGTLLCIRLKEQRLAQRWRVQGLTCLFMPVQEHLGIVLLHPLCALQGEAMCLLRGCGKGLGWGLRGCHCVCCQRCMPPGPICKRWHQVLKCRCCKE